MSAATLVTIAVVVSASLIVAYNLGRFTERDSIARAALRRLTADVRSDTEWERIVRTAKRRVEVRRMGLVLVRGGRRERGPFA